MEFVQNFTPPDFQVKNFTPPISPNFNSFSKKKHKKLVKMEKYTPLATNFTLPPGLTGWTNFTSAPRFAKSSRDSLSVDAPYLMSLKKSIFPQRMTFQTDKNMRQPELL